MTNDYKVLARKYRPQKFNEIIGQEVLVQTLINAIKKNKIHHAFILTGIRGVGKTTTARLIAKSLNCIGPDGLGKETVDICLECSHCKAIANGNDPDVIEFDAASNTGVDKIRDIIENINYAPINSRYKIYIIDEVHMLSNSAFNALLKTLEEPPVYVKFIFATTEIREVPITILSRCIRFDLNKISHEKLIDYLFSISNREGYILDKIAASLIANASEGSVRDALSILDRVISFNNFSKNISEDVVTNILGLSGQENIYDFFSSLINKNKEEILLKFNNLYYSIISIDYFLNDLLNITHMLIMKKNNIVSDNLSSFQIKWLDNNENILNLTSLFRLWQFLIKAVEEIKNVTNIKNYLEVLFIKICYGINLPEIGDLIKKLKNNSNDLKSNKKEDLTSMVLNTFEGSKII